MSARVLLAAVGALASGASAQVVYGVSNGYGTASLNRIYQINPANAQLTNIVPITVPGHTVSNALSIAANPLDGSLWTILRTTPIGGAPARRLATIDPSTGVATIIGTLSDDFSYLAFRASGVLYGVTGDGAATPETLYTINTSTAAATLVFPLGNGADGEVIAFGGDGLLYHSSGNLTALFESVNVDTQLVTPIGSTFSEMLGIGFHPGSGVMYGSNLVSELFTINLATGARTLVGDMTGQLGTSANNRGFAVVQPVLCYPNCDASTTPPVLNVLDFNCFLNAFSAGASYANCDHSTTPPVLNVLDFNCFLNAFSAGCP
jgi:hypothetical protein